MDRRTFFKGMFSVAVVAAIPKPMFDSIVTTPSEPEFEKLCSVPDSNGLFIFDEDRLVGWTSMFSVDYKQHMVDVTTSYDYYPQYIRGLREWRILASDINLPPEYLTGNKTLKAVMKYRDVEFYGDVILTPTVTQIPLDDAMSFSACFIGYGALIMSVE